MLKLFAVLNTTPLELLDISSLSLILRNVSISLIRVFWKIETSTWHLDWQPGWFSCFPHQGRQNTLLTRPWLPWSWNENMMRLGLEAAGPDTWYARGPRWDKQQCIVFEGLKNRVSTHSFMTWNTLTTHQHKTGLLSALLPPAFSIGCCLKWQCSSGTSLRCGKLE